MFWPMVVMLPILIPLIVWSIIWKGIGLWKAARNEHKGWFIAILVFNTLGLLPIIYIFFVSNAQKQKMQPTAQRMQMPKAGQAKNMPPASIKAPAKARKKSAKKKR